VSGLAPLHRVVHLEPFACIAARTMADEPTTRRRVSARRGASTAV